MWAAFGVACLVGACLGGVVGLWRWVLRGAWVGRAWSWAGVRDRTASARVAVMGAFARMIFQEARRRPEQLLR